jgi:hypothetical protein
MLVNKIDTGVICGNTGKRPLQLIFPPASGQAGALCGPRILLHRRNGPGFFSFDYVLPGTSIFEIYFIEPFLLFQQVDQFLLLISVFRNELIRNKLSCTKN